MCGIAGTFGGAPLDPATCKATLDAMLHRGPDAEALWSGEIAGKPLTLLHSRLSIIDPQERSDQPFIRDGMVLVFNGEIYNFEAIREELLSKGHRFETQGDAEVILEAYRAWGTRAVESFEGMWALALADLKRGLLWLSRDRFGEKPLCLLESGGAVYFASETRALWCMAGRRATPNLTQLRRYLVNGYKSLGKTSDTFYQNVRELPPACNLVLSAGRKATEERYWQLRYDPVEMTLGEAEEQAANLLETSLDLRMKSDVPLAFCLSGGVDSSTMVGMAACRLGHEVHAYSVYDGDARYDESRNIEATVNAVGCHHFIARTSRESFRERLTELIVARDQPFATLSFYMTSFLCEQIQRDGYKVALTGNGADELFTGYYDHYNFWLASLPAQEDLDRHLRDWNESYGRFVRNPVLRDPLAFRKDNARRDHIYLNRNQFNQLLREPLEEDFQEEKYSEDLLHSRMLNEIHHEALPPQLRENDLIFMHYSIENRTPYLDRQLAEFLYTVPLKHLIVGGYPKWLLRAAGQDLYPDSIRLDKRKRGFNAPITSLFDAADANNKEWLLHDGPLFEVVERQRLCAMLKDPVERNSLSKFLFNVINCKLFLEAQRTG